MIKKKVDARDKKEITRGLSSAAIKKFYCYQITKPEFARKEQIDLEPLCIVYDPSYSEDENAPVPWFFTDQIHLANRSHVGKIVNRKEEITHPTSRPCPFCQNIFAKSVENMNKHTKICVAREGITYAFHNGDIISSQDNCKYMETFSLQYILILKQLLVTTTFLTQKCMFCPTVRYMLSTLVLTLKKL